MRKILLPLYFSIFFFFGLLYAQTEEAHLLPIQYLSAENVYLKGGAEDGVEKGMILRIVRKDITIGSVRVEFVAAHSSSCRIISFTSPFRAGDTAVLVKASESADSSAVKESPVEQEILDKPEATPPVAKEVTKPRSRTNRSRVSGSISASQYQYIDSRSDLRNYSQPSLRVNLRGRNIRRPGYNFRIRTRSRYINRGTSSPGRVNEEDWQNRLYEASFSYDAPEAFLQYRLGRIITNHLSGIGYIDGAQISVKNGSYVRSGLFAGLQPDPTLESWDTGSFKSGAFVTLEKGDYLQNRIETTLAVAGEYSDSEISREFLFLQTNYSVNRKFSFYFSSELDVNRGWRKERAGNTLELSSAYLSGRFQFSKNVNLTLQYDNRQNYWSAATRSMDAVLFDELLRQGYRGILSLRLPYRISLSINGGLRSAEGEEDALTGGSRLYIPTFIFSPLSLSFSGAGFRNTFNEGYNATARMGLRILSSQRLELYYGRYGYTIASIPGPQLNEWTGINLNLLLRRHYYFLGQYEVDWGSDREGQTFRAEIGYRL